jgi:hypothetical protein
MKRSGIRGRLQAESMVGNAAPPFACRCAAKLHSHAARGNEAKSFGNRFLHGIGGIKRDYPLLATRLGKPASQITAHVQRLVAGRGAKVVNMVVAA